LHVGVPLANPVMRMCCLNGPPYTKLSGAGQVVVEARGLGESMVDEWKSTFQPTWCRWMHSRSKKSPVAMTGSMSLRVL